MKFPALSIALAILLLFELNACSRSADVDEKIQQVEKNLAGNIRMPADTSWTLSERMAHYNVKGLSVAVIHNYQMEWAKAYGWADEGLRIPATSQTLFQAASISKSVNALGVLKLVQDKKLDLYTDINNYLTTWKFPYNSLSKGKKISVANLLSHTGGLTVHGFGGYQRAKDTVPTILQILNGKSPANSAAVRSMYEPGLRSEYSGGGITISQLIVMDITRQPYDKYMYDNVLKPLGMTSSTYTQPPNNVKAELLATGYDSGGNEIPGKYHIYPEQAAAGLWTNPTDLAKYMIETQLSYQGKSQKILIQQSTKLRLTPYLDKSAALGVFIDELDGAKYFQHGGANEGFRCHYYGSLEGGNGVVVMVNSDDDRIIDEIINSVAKVYGFKGLNRSKLHHIVAVSDALLDSYTGEYKVEQGFNLFVTRDGHQLYGQASGQPRFELFAETPSKFFLTAEAAEIEFVKDSAGKVVNCIIYQGGEHNAKKIK